MPSCNPHSLLLRFPSADRILLHATSTLDLIELVCGEAFTLKLYSHSANQSLGYLTFSLPISAADLTHQLQAAFPDLAARWPGASAEALLQHARAYQETAAALHSMSGPFDQNQFRLLHLSSGAYRKCTPTMTASGIRLCFEDGTDMALDDPAVLDVSVNRLEMVQISGRWMPVAYCLGHKFLNILHVPDGNPDDIGLDPVHPYDGAGWTASVERVEHARVLRRSILDELRLIQAL